MGEVDSLEHPIQNQSGPFQPIPNHLREKNRSRKIRFFARSTGPKRRAPRVTYSTIRSAADGKVFLKKRDINQFQPETTEKKVEI
jgi:hypothetical protein